MKTLSKMTVLGGAILLLAAGVALASQFYPIRATYDFPLVRERIPDSTRDAQAIQSSTAGIDASQVASSASTAEQQRATPPARVRIEVPFASQAPSGDWSMPYQEACEETSLILVHYFLEGKAITPALADEEIRKLVEWEVDHFGYYADTTIEQVKETAELYYNHDARIVYDPTIEDIKRELAEGHPIIAPFAGRDLGNPYYSGEGPWYHMMVITGYDGTHFITNDVGTRRGEGYRYRYATLMNALHNWTGVKENIREGRAAILVVTP